MNFKMTEPRKLILNLFNESKQPMSAETIYEKLDRKVFLSTIYRNIELFLNNQIISRLFIDNISYYYINKTDHKHFMICLTCHDMFEIPCSHLDEKLIGTHKNFKVITHELNVYGYCEKCQA